MFDRGEPPTEEADGEGEDDDGGDGAGKVDGGEEDAAFFVVPAKDKLLCR